VLAQLAQAGEELDDLAEGTGGRVAVGTLLAAAARLLPAAIAALRRERPRVSVTVVEGTNDRLVPALVAGDLDLIVGRLPAFRHRDGLAHERLLVEDACVVVRAGHALRRRRRLALADLAALDWILPPPEATLRRQVDQAFHDAGLDAPRPGVQSLSLLTNRALLLATDMIAVWPRQVALDDVRRGVLAILPVALPPTAGPIGIARRRGAILSPAAAALCDALRAAARAQA
jgi:DNA-binding transcriptional LysR family regulator